jgi:hypothetical protein
MTSPAHDSTPAKYIDGRTQHDILMAAAFSQGFGQCIRTEVPSSRPWHFGFSLAPHLLYYTCVKFNQEKNELGKSRGRQRRPGQLRAPRPPLPSVQLKGIRRSDQDFWCGRFVGCCLFPGRPNSACVQRLLASLTRASFPPVCFPKTVSSTRRQYASMTFAFSADSPLVTRISGPNPESVAVRLTIM